MTDKVAQAQDELLKWIKNLTLIDWDSLTALERT
jgi:hypothetical protein